MVILAELLKQAISLPKAQKRHATNGASSAPTSTNNKKRKRNEKLQSLLPEENEELENPRKISSPKIKKILDYRHSITLSCCADSIANVDKEIWHYLQKDLFHRDPLCRLRVIELIHELAVALPSFRIILSEDLPLVVRSAGLLRSISITVRNKDIVKGSLIHQAMIENCVKEKIEIWDTLFGEELEKFHLMKRYFVESLKLDMPKLKVHVLIIFLHQ